MEEAPTERKGRGRIAMAAAAGVAAVAIAVPVSGAFAESSSSSSSQQGSSSQQAPAFDDVQLQNSQRPDDRDCPEKDGNRGGSGSQEGSSAPSGNHAQQL